MTDKKPLHFAETDEPDLATLAAAQGELGYHVDANYIPGYTEQVYANSISEAVRTPEGGGFGEETKQEYYRRFGCGPKPLPVHMTWVRAVGADGGPSFNANVRLSEWQRLGYRPVTKDDFASAGLLGELGYKPPPASQLTPDQALHQNFRVHTKTLGANPWDSIPYKANMTSREEYRPARSRVATY
jgi:hypothetical protein